MEVNAQSSYLVEISIAHMYRAAASRDGNTGRCLLARTNNKRRRPCLYATLEITRLRGPMRVVSVRITRLLCPLMVVEGHGAGFIGYQRGDPARPLRSCRTVVDLGHPLCCCRPQTALRLRARKTNIPQICLTAGRLWQETQSPRHSPRIVLALDKHADAERKTAEPAHECSVVAVERPNRMMLCAAPCY